MVPFEGHYFFSQRFVEVEFIYVLLVLLIKTPFVSLIDCSRQLPLPQSKPQSLSVLLYLLHTLSQHLSAAVNCSRYLESEHSLLSIPLSPPHPLIQDASIRTMSLFSDPLPTTPSLLEWVT